jgi:hypothetical protein
MIGVPASVSLRFMAFLPSWLCFAPDRMIDTPDGAVASWPLATSRAQPRVEFAAPEKCAATVLYERDATGGYEAVDPRLRAAQILGCLPHRQPAVGLGRLRQTRRELFGERVERVTIERVEQNLDERGAHGAAHFARGRAQMIRETCLGAGERRFGVGAIAVIDRDPTRPANDFSTDE